MRVAAVILVALPILGIAVHVWLLLGPAERVDAYLRSRLVWVSVGLAFANLLASYFHRRHTRMRLSVAARILSNLWILSALVLLYLRLTGRLGG